MIRTFILIVITLFGIRLFAAASMSESEIPAALGDEKEIQVRAKKRLYPGGRDEEPLKVQTQLPQAIRKMGAADEAASEPVSDD